MIYVKNYIPMIDTLFESADEHDQFSAKRDDECIFNLLVYLLFLK